VADTDNGGKPQAGGSGDSGNERDGERRLPGRPEEPAHPDGAPAGGDAPEAASDPGSGPTAESEHESGSGSGGSGDGPQPGPRSASAPEPGPGSDPGREPAPGPSRTPEQPGNGGTPPAPDGRGPGRQGPDGPDKPRRARPFGGGILMGRPFGVPVYVAPSWFLVAALITWVFGGQLDRVLPDLGAVRYLIALFFAVAFYASVLVHELAHTVAALRFKLPVRRIQLQFFGGVSEIEKEAETPGREFVLAFVGPLLSLVLAGVFYAGMKAVAPGTVPGVLLAGLMLSNLIVAVFNLLPGLPWTAAGCCAHSSGSSAAGP